MASSSRVKAIYGEMEPLFLCSEPRVLTKAASPGTHHIEFVEAEIEDVLGKVYRPQE